jgi:hypothetical protein
LSAAVSTEVQTHKDNLFQGLKKVKEEQPSDPGNDVFKSPANGMLHLVVSLGLRSIARSFIMNL